MACTTGNHRIYAIISQSVGMFSFAKFDFVTSIMLLQCIPALYQTSPEITANKYWI